MNKFLRYPLRRLRHNLPRLADDLALLVGWLLLIAILLLFGFRLSLL